jgi:hypothetical protein
VASDGRLEPATLYDIMNAGRLTNEAWIQPVNYQALYDALGTLQSGCTMSQIPTVVHIQGIFNSTGSELLRLYPVYRWPWPVPVPPVPPECSDCPYLAVITSTTGEAVKLPFNALVAAPEVTPEHGFFDLQAQVDGDIASLQMSDMRSGKTLAEVTPAKAPPTITLTSPKAGEQLGETTTISWNAQYSVPDDQVQYQIAYSPDNGQTFVPLAVGVAGATRQITVDTREIQKSGGQGLIRVFLGDGLNTVYSDVTGLTTAAAIY